MSTRPRLPLVDRLLIWGIAAFAFLIRIPNLRWGFPEVEEEAHPVRVAFKMWGWDEGRIQLDPQTAGWPALSFYAHFALQQVQYWFGKLTGRYDDRLDFFVDHVDVATLMPAARFLSLVLGVAIVAIGARLGQRLAGRVGALVAGLVLALSPLLLEHSLKVTPDIFLTLFSALALGACFDVRETGRLRDYVLAAVWIGLGVASKYTPVLLVPCLVTAHLMREWRTDGEVAPIAAARWRALLDRRLWIAGAVCAATFFAASPYTLLNLAATKRDVAAQFSHVVTSGHFGVGAELPGPVYYFVKVLPQSLGWPALALGVAGLALAAWRRRGDWILVLVYFAGFYAGLGALRSLNPHYVLPVLLPIALGAAGLARELRLAGAPAPRPALAAVLLAFLLVPLALGCLRQSLLMARPSTLLESKKFVMEALNAPDTVFATEVGGPDLPWNPHAEFGQRPIFAQLDASTRERLLSRPFVHRYEINVYQTDPHGTDFYYDLRHYLDFDYVIVSGTAVHRYVALASEFPRQSAFYADLKQYGTFVRHFPETPGRRGPDVWIYKLVPESRRILQERGPLTRASLADFTKEIRPNDLRSFLGFTGHLAQQREDWPAADLYLGMLMDLWPETRDELLLNMAYVKYRVRNFTEASRLCAELLQKHPGDPKILTLAAGIQQEIVAQRNAAPTNPQARE